MPRSHFSRRSCRLPVLVALCALVVAGLSPVPGAAQDGPSRAAVIESLRDQEPTRKSLAAWLEDGANPRDDRAVRRASYLNTLRTLALEPAATRLEDSMNEQRGTEPDGFAWYETLAHQLRRYRMLSGQAPADREVIHDVIVESLREEIGDEAMANQHDVLIDGHAGTVADLVLSDSNRRFQREWRIRPNYATATRTEMKLRVEEWIGSALHQMMGDGAGRFPPVGRDQLLPGVEGRERLEMPVTVPGLFTQAGYDGYLEAAFEDYSTRIANLLEQAQVRNRYPAPVIVGRFCAELSREARLAWRAMYESARIAPFENLADAADGVALLASPQSPLRVLFWTVWALRPLHLPQSAYNIEAGGNPGRWIPESLAVVSRIADALRELLRHREDASFIELAREGGLTGIGNALAASRALFRQAASSADPEMISGIIGLLHSLPDQVMRVLYGDAVQALNDHWRTDVFEPFQKLAAAFPFAPEAEADADPQTVVAMLGADGTVANALALVDEVRDALPGIQLVEEYTPLDRRLRRLREVFGEDGATPTTQLIVELAAPAGATGVIVTIGETEIPFERLRPDLQGIRRCLLQHTTHDPPAAGFRGKLADGREFGVKRNGPWALMRLMAAADRTDSADLGQRMLHTFFIPPAPGDDGDNGGDGARDNAPSFQIVVVVRDRGSGEQAVNRFAGLRLPRAVVQPGD